ncbi:L-lysine exporter family protein LysE/ArgO [Lysinibacter cavernae]|uniref:L-lysine exporter family protein LysE/ArgO n=2 Tax=Lysinibacter cavernae TaxID=1640652 RepID=A0A7X5R205_9MICO|nr:L-lysine exporter family protein LysE/ArgO [Lysinibacter cavernae]
MNTFLPHMLAGLGLGFSLIIAIGVQNIFVLRQGIRGEHVLPVVLVCALSDAALILLGVTGLGVIIERAPLLITIIRWAGAAFLLTYAVLAARRVFTANSLDVTTEGKSAGLGATVLAVLALTWLNPHVYLDTVLLLGSIANTHGIDGRWWFAVGAVLASVIWFTALGYGARLLRPLFAKPIAWRVLDAIIAVVMLVLGVKLVLP